MSYNGHPNYNAWNVALWISNDEGLYRWAIELKRDHGSAKAAEIMLAELPRNTPDGIPWTKTNLRRAIAGL